MSKRSCGFPQGDFLPGPGFVDLSCDNPDLFDWATNEDVGGKADALTAACGVMGAVEFKKMQRNAR